MRFLKEFENFFREKKNKKFSIIDIDSFIKEISLDRVTEISNQAPHNTKALGKHVVYSTYCGSTKNKTFNARLIESDVKHYFISNNEDVLISAEKKGWTPYFLDLPVYDNLIYSSWQAKIAKAMPHIFPFIENYQYSMYLDDKLNFDVNLLSIYEGILACEDAAIALREHDFLKSNVLAEFSEAMKHKRYFVLRERTINYISNEIESGYSLRAKRVWWTSAIFRNMRHREIKEINQAWYLKILNCGINCQISFDFLAQNYSSISVLPQKIEV